MILPFGMLIELTTGLPSTVALSLKKSTKSQSRCVEDSRLLVSAQIQLIICDFARPAKSEIYRHFGAYVHIHRGIYQSALGPQPTQARLQAPRPAEAVQELPARDAPVVRHGRQPLRASPWGSNNYGNLKRGRLARAHPSNARGTLMARTLARSAWTWSP